MPLGLGRGDFSEVEIELKPGSSVVFYSDGITEAENLDEEEYGLLRMQEHLLQPGACADGLLADVRSFADGVELRDDATVIMVKMLA
jgi:sigma-B regulation protein RsbU (phosphoserine phosphatase)